MSEQNSDSVYRAGVTNNLLLLFVLLVLVGLESYVLFFAGPGTPIDEAELLEQVEGRLSSNSEAIQAEAKDLAAQLLPRLGEALYRRSREDYGKYIRTLRQEGEVFAGNLQDILVKKVQAQSDTFLDGHRQVLEEEFPEFARSRELDQIVQDMRDTLDRVSQRYYLQEFARESDRTVECWRGIEPIAVPGKDDPTLEEQLVEYATDWSVLVFAEEAERVVDRAIPKVTSTPAEEGDE